MSEKLNFSERVQILREIGRLRAIYLYLGLKEAKALLSARLGEVVVIYLERKRVSLRIVELRRKYNEGSKGGVR